MKFCTIRRRGRYYLVVNETIFVEQSLDAVIARMGRLRLMIDEHRRPGENRVKNTWKGANNED
jgi:hypothetical protein